MKYSVSENVSSSVLPGEQTNSVRAKRLPGSLPLSDYRTVRGNGKITARYTMNDSESRKRIHDRTKLPMPVLSPVFGEIIPSETVKVAEAVPPDLSDTVS